MRPAATISAAPLGLRGAAAGWLVACLSEFSERGVNLTRIESRPSRLELGHYLFLIDVAGSADAPGATAEAIEALAGHCRQLRILGSFPAA